MKTKVTIIMILLLSGIATVTHAQIADAAFVKILPAASSNHVKVLYAESIDKPVTITFFDASGFVDADKIKGPVSGGVMKTYNVSKMNRSEYWVEISSKDVAVRYHIVPDTNGNNFTAKLEKSTYKDSLVASK